MSGVFFGMSVIPIQETPKINPIFEIFDPTTAPIAIFSLWLITEEIPTKISGAEVPKATTVRPIVNSLTPNLLAIDEELSINLSAPHINTPKEANRPKKLIKKAILHFTSVDYKLIMFQKLKMQYNIY